MIRVLMSDGTFKGHRPPGGGIEFGETAVEALKREMMEELGEKIEVGQKIAIVENIFEHDGRQGHEIMFIYEMTFANPAILGQNKLLYVEPGKEGEWMEWVNPFTSSLPVYPTGLVDVMKERGL
jgi:ADP-ribose pyrophosphatase YjhB (NUDIX family)